MPTTIFSSTLLFVLLVYVPALAAGQTVTVVNGTIAPYWDQSLAGFELTGDGTRLHAEFFGGSPTPGLRVGDVADLSTTITVSVFTSNHPFAETVNGTTYPSVWVRAQLRITAAPFVVPPRPSADTFNALSTAFTLSGEFAGYSDRAMTNQVFSVSVRGVGVAEFSWTTFQNETYLAFGGGGTIYRLTPPVDVRGRSGPGSGRIGREQPSCERHLGTALRIRYVRWRTLNDDGEVIARIRRTHTVCEGRSGERRSPWDASSAHVAIAVKPDQ